MKKLTIFFIAVALLLSCNKSDIVNSNENSEKISLYDFLLSLRDDDKVFVDRSSIVDNSNFKTNSFKRMSEIVALNQREEVVEELAKIKFRWHGTNPNGHGCEKFVGICLTIPISFGEQFVESEANALLTIVNDKLIIEPTTGENGLTSDGYLPIGNYVLVKEDILIKPGIYKGNSDRIVVDLVKSN